MKILTQSLLLTALLHMGAVLAADTQDFDVTQSMSVAQFRAAGLDKLSEAQLKALNTWFSQYQQQLGPVCAGTAAHSAAPQAAAPEASVAPAVAAAPTMGPDDSINAHIAGDFDGWRGGTRFTLDNGQVWEQVDDSIVTVKRIADPKVTITRGLFNSYYMSVQGMSDSVQVKRIKG